MGAKFATGFTLNRKGAEVIGDAGDFGTVLGTVAAVIGDSATPLPPSDNEHSSTSRVMVSSCCLLSDPECPTPPHQDEKGDIPDLTWTCPLSFETLQEVSCAILPGVTGANVLSIQVESGDNGFSFFFL